MQVLRFSQRYSRRCVVLTSLLMNVSVWRAIMPRILIHWATLKIDATICSEALVCIYRSTHHHTLEDGNYHWEFFWLGERLITVIQQVCCMVLLGRVCKLCRNTADPPLAARTSSNPSTGLDRSWGLQEFEAHRIFRQLAHSGGKLVSAMHGPPLPPRKYSW
jgi:hypothetical protein